MKEEQEDIAIFDHIAKWIAAGKVEKSIHQLLYILRTNSIKNENSELNEIYKKVSLASSRFNKLKRNVENGFLDYATATREENKITALIIDANLELKKLFVFNVKDIKDQKEYKKDDLHKKKHPGKGFIVKTWIKIDREFDTFNEKDKDDFLQTMQELLKINQSIEVKQVKEGCVLIRIDIDKDLAELINDGFEKGKLDKLNVIDIYNEIEIVDNDFFDFDVNVLNIDIEKLKTQDRIDLSYTNHESYDFLTELSDVLAFNFENSNFSKLELLSKQQNTITLILNNSSIQSLNPISGLKNLKYLSLDNTDVDSLTPIKNLLTIKGISIKNTKIQSITPLKKLHQLQELHLDNNKIRDIKVLSHLKNLNSLSLADTPISRIAALGYLTKLENLSLTNCKLIRDFDELKYLTQLKYLDLAYTRLVDFTILSNLRSLKYLNLQGVNFEESDVLKLSSLIDLEFLNLEDNGNFTRRNLAKIKAILPNCYVKIDDDGFENRSFIRELF